MEGHIPVLKSTVLETFKAVNGCVLDGTFGGGGHTQALLEQNEKVSIVGLDVDPEAQERSQIIQNKFPHRFAFYPINFSELASLNKNFDGVLLDLGVSSFQLDDAHRGFSFRNEGPLDMRMNPNGGLSAKEFLQKASPEALTQAIRGYGEEPQWRSVVRSILKYRDATTWETTTAFVQFLDENTTLHRSQKPGIHFATRVFQGLRIAVNDELNHLRKGLDAAFEALKPKGILAVISFHSLEDRIVKQCFYGWCGRSLDRYDHRPQQLRTVQAELLSRKPIMATEQEISENPRARSAKYRILKKL